MKHDEYKVIYFNGNEETFYCFSINEAWATAMYFAITKGWDVRIRYIYHTEKHITYSDFNLSYLSSQTI